MHIAVTAPSKPLDRRAAKAVQALAASRYPQVRLTFAEQCFANDGHFAGNDSERLAALCAMAERADVDALWFACGGYGSCRIAAQAAAAIAESPTARAKYYMGYSDQGNLLAALARAGIAGIAHGPMPVDIQRKGGEVAIARALDWLVNRDPTTLEPNLESGENYMAFNLITLSMLLGTDLEPDMSGHIIYLEEVGEYLYATDRAFFHVAANLAKRGIRGIRLGRVGDIIDNDRPFGATAEDIARHWCAQFGIAWLGRADIGHDSENHVVPFGYYCGAGA